MEMLYFLSDQILEFCPVFLFYKLHQYNQSVWWIGPVKHEYTFL